MANFLLTGSRAPVTLELARNLALFDHKVILADSLRYPIASNSKAVTRSYLVCDPRGNLNKFGESLIEIIKNEKIDILIPTCEEILYVSRLLSKLKKYCQVFCNDFKLLKQLHSKYQVLNLANELPIRIPHTIQFRNEEELSEKCLIGFIIKPEFGRFGQKILFNPDQSQLSAYLEELNQNCVLQEKIVGTEYCTYALAVNGKVMASVIYEPKYRLGSSASYYFKSEHQPKIDYFVQQFCEKVNFTGNIGFDIIVSNGEPYLIECNPRITSGLHLLWKENLADCILRQEPLQKNTLYPSAQVSLAMLFLGLPRAISKLKIKKWWHDLRAARDVIHRNGDRFFLFFIFLSLLELLQIAFRNKISIRSAATQGVEWNGEDAS